MKMTSNRGFSLIELMVVIAMIAILAALTVPRVNQAFDMFQFSNSIRMMLNTMNRAKGEAMSTGLFTTVVFTTDANGRARYAAFVDDGSGGGITRNGIRDGSERSLGSGMLPSGVVLNNTTFQRTAIGNNPFTQFSSTGFPVGVDPNNGAALINYSGNIRYNTTIGDQLVTKNIQLGLGGRLSIN